MNRNDPLGFDKDPGAGGKFPRPAPFAVSILGLLLVAYAMSSAGYCQCWPDTLEMSTWVALPVAIALWTIAVRNKPVPPLRCPERLAAILPSPSFFWQLRRERLRADRSGTSLSIFLFSFDEGMKHGIADPRAAHFLERLRAALRETDVLGHIGDGRVGLLLIDTGMEGREAFLKKLLAGQEELPVSMVRGTYPDQVFDNFMTENRDAAKACLIFPDVVAPRAGFGYPLKRAVDVAGAAVGIVLLSPLLLLAAIAIKLTSPGPIIFRQTRLGKNGAPFVFYKFRSMAWNADDRIHREYVASLIAGNVPAPGPGDAGRPMYKLQADPRVTRIGRIIRKTSIDELPQLFNVLKGEMSLVGPRPPLPYEAEKYQSWHFWRIFEAKPGITGLWQVEGRSRTSFDDMVRLDLEYSRSCSLLLDLRILFKTVRVVLRGVGAA